MSDAAITTIVTGLVTIVGMVVGFLTLWVKLQHAGTKAEEAATKAMNVERKLDANTIITNAVDTKTDTIVEQTNGSMDAIRNLVQQIAERVSRLEDYNRTSSHRLFDAINALHLKVATMTVSQPQPTLSVPTSSPTPPSKGTP